MGQFRGANATIFQMKVDHYGGLLRLEFHPKKSPHPEEFLKFQGFSKKLVPLWAYGVLLRTPKGRGGTDYWF